MDFAINFLPPGGLSSSVITTVWVGVMVVAFFNLRFGTTLSGLVVPGYLVPLFIVHPVSAWVVIIESLLTYLIARVIADRGLVRLGLGEMFGRDRFFMLILISVLVRIVTDGFVLPLLSEQLAQLGAPYEMRSALHSFGLIIIALCANLMWNGGIKVGCISLALYIGCTYFLVEYVLMPFTNFNISTLGYMYEDIASSILASPKAYIILITAAFISSRMNLRYGWDFNGILIPSLLALQWYDPFKILATFVEAIVVLMCAQVVMKLPVLKAINFEGARQMILFFNVGFGYKVLLGFAIVYWMPEQKVTDFYGFGYVLATLMALKMYQNGIAIRFTRTTLQTSLVAVIFASLFGYALTLSPTTALVAVESPLGDVQYDVSDHSLGQFVDKIRLQSYQSDNAELPIIPLGTTLSDFKKLFMAMRQLRYPVEPAQLSGLAQLAKQVGYRVSLIEQRYIALDDVTPTRGWGSYLVDAQAKSQMAIEVPKALDEPKAAAVALPVFQALNARYLSYAGARASRSDDGNDNVLLNAQLPMQMFHQAVANNNALQLRSYTRSTARQLLGVRQDKSALDLDIAQSSVYVKRTLPNGLPLKRLETLLGGFAIYWHSPKTQNRQRDTAINGFVEVYLNEDSLLNIFSKAYAQQDYEALAKTQSIDGYLQSYLLDGQLDFAARGSDAYITPYNYELLYFDQTVLQNAFTLIDSAKDGKWLPKQHQQLRQVAFAASRFNYNVRLYRHVPNNAYYLIIEPNKALEPTRHWGTYVLKVGHSSNYIVEVPRPIYERNTYEFGTMLFEKLDARALLISGAHPLANSDGSAEVTRVRNSDSLFNLFHQSLLSHYAGAEPFSVSIRGFEPEFDEMKATVVVAHFEYQKPGARRHLGLQRLKETIGDTGVALKDFDERQIAQRFEAKLNAQSRFTRFVSDAQYAEVWLPSLVRSRFERLGPDDALAVKIAATGLKTLLVDIDQVVAMQAKAVEAEAKLLQAKTLLKAFAASHNVTQLNALKALNAKTDILVDNNSGQYYVRFVDAFNNITFLANLMPLSANSYSSNVREFVANRKHFWHLEAEQ